MEGLDGAQRIIFKHFIVSAGFIIEDIMGMGQKKQSIIRIDCKTINSEGFYQLYSVLISYFSFVFGVINRDLREAVKNTAAEVTDRPQTIQEISKKLTKHYSKSTGEIKLNVLGGQVWDEIAEITKYGDRNNPGKLIYFIQVSGEALKEALKRINADLNGGRPDKRIYPKQI